EITEYTPDGTDGLQKEYALSLFPKTNSVDEIPRKYISEKKFLLGTDKYGRDLLSRMLIGIRIPLAIGFVAVFISLVIGITIGTVAGSLGAIGSASLMSVSSVTGSIAPFLWVRLLTEALAEVSGRAASGGGRPVRAARG